MIPKKRKCFIIQADKVTAALNGKQVLSTSALLMNDKGFAAIGTNSYGISDFDNFRLASGPEGRLRMNSYSKADKYFEDRDHGDNDNKNTLFFKPEHH